MYLPIILFLGQNSSQSFGTSIRFQNEAVGCVELRVDALIRISFRFPNDSLQSSDHCNSASVID